MNLQAKDDPLTAIRVMIDALEKFKLDIQTALWYSGNVLDFDDVCSRVFSRAYDMYILPNSMILCEVLHYPKHKVYHVAVAAGELDELIEWQQNSLPKEAKLRDCNLLTLSGRRGWVKSLSSYGWDELGTILVRKM